ncbi:MULTISPECIES: type VII secretion integral membrane protein EccD [unclassified Streptosporangium]|uniref:type VII secretion integral membrane protein EccD n=1 Tax=unclassified Streptosporangium TaxID=2632669 RepID=UPI002E29EABE|nr:MULTISPECIES: type VII secretion integral membrane protein EccD [unclassified Streptosporangium]
MSSLARPPVQGLIPPTALARVAAPLPALCHVTVVAPGGKADLALPADLPLPHILPGLLRAIGEAGGESAAVAGWALQRLGGTPLDLGQSLGALGVLDGEVLYLRPREAMLPPALFDDVADVVAMRIKDGPGIWATRHTRLAGVALGMVFLVTGVLCMTLAGPPWTVPTVLSGVFALLLIAAGAAVSRAVGDSGAGALIGYAALPYGFLAGLLVPLGAGELSGIGAPHLLSAFAATALVGTFGFVAVVDGVSGFLGVVVASVIGAVGAAIVMLSGASVPGVAAMAVTIMLAFGPLTSTLSFRLAGMPMPSMPTNAEELRSDDQKVDGPAIGERAGQARQYATGLVMGTALVGLVAQVCLVLDSRWIATATALTLSLICLMRVRVFQGLGQRIWLMATGMTGIVAYAISTAAAGGGPMAVGVAAGLLLVAAIPAGIGLSLPAGKPSPFWGRAGDIVETLLVVALFPLALGVLDVYSWVRGLAG